MHGNGLLMLFNPRSGSKQIDRHNSSAPSDDKSMNEDIYSGSTYGKKSWALFIRF